MGAGGYKYGFYNYRDTEISASTYFSAVRRHMDLWFDGEDNDPIDCGEGKPPGSGANHLICAAASLCLLYDAQVNGKLADDRSTTGKIRELMDEAAAQLTKFQKAHDEFVK